MEPQQTCGRGLAEHSALPARLGELTSAMVEILETHQTALDVSDENGRNELHAYVKLAQEFRLIATQLHTTAEHMAAYRDLPMARHDPRAMAQPRTVDVFAKFVRLEHELMEQLRHAVERDQRMLAAMRGHSG